MSEHYDPRIEAVFRVAKRQFCEKLNEHMAALAAAVTIELARIKSKPRTPAASRRTVVDILRTACIMSS